MLLKSILAMFAVCILGWDILLLFFAEIGRRDDLRRATSKIPPPFKFAIIVTLLHDTDRPALNQLIDALLTQTPSQGRQPDIYVVSPAEIHAALVTLSYTFPESVRLLPCPQEMISSPAAAYCNNEVIGKMHAWAVERLLAIGGNTRLFVFLEATDIVKSDYLQQIALKAAYYPVMQGYLAIKKLGDDMASRNIGLKLRLMNRIEQAGRFHLGLSAALQPTGWSAHQDVLEKVPMDRFLTDYPRAYGLILNRVGYRIHWAPNMVTYKEEAMSFWQYVQSEYYAAVNKIKLFMTQLPSTLQFAIVRRQPMVTITQLWDILPLPHDYMSIVLLLAWVVSMQTPYSGFIGTVFFAHLFLQVSKLFVARIRFQEAMFCSGLVVWYRLVSLAVMPAIAIKTIFDRFILSSDTGLLGRKQAMFNLSETTRKLQLPNISLTDDAWGSSEPAPQKTSSNTVSYATEGLSAYSQSPVSSNRPGITAQLSNGDKVLDCLIMVDERHESALPEYQLQLSYRGNTFSTGYYQNQDDAFDALQDKLKLKGFTILFDTPQLSSK